MKTFKLLLLTTLLSLSLIGFSTAVLAAFGDETLEGIKETAGSGAIYQTSGSGTERIIGIVGLIINGLLGAVAAVFVIVLIYGGFIWMSASGNENKIEEAKKYIMSGIFGLAVVFAAAAVTLFLFNALKQSLGS